MTDHVDVLIAGGGPTGLTLACDLLRRGLSTRLVDRADSGFGGSRAKGLQPRSLEVFDDLDVLEDILGHATDYPKLGIHLGPITVPKTMIRQHAPSEDVPYPNTLLIPQYDTDACLRRRFHALGGTVEFNSHLVSFDQHDGKVTARIEGTTGTRAIEAQFLVGADGGASVVRKHAGIAFEGSTDDTDRIILADVRVKGLSRNRWHMWPRPGGRFTGLCPLPGPDRFQLMIRLRPGEECSLDLESLNRRTHAVTGYNVTAVDWTSVWRPNVRLAERYRDRKVFIAGDAAHVHTPAGAQGLNTGVQDAYNLGWKLGQVLAGAPDSLLDTYEAERRPVAARVLGLSSERYSAISGRVRAAAKRGDEERQLAITYRSGPLAPPGLAQEGLEAGDRAPDAHYGSRRLFDDFRGPHFTLVAVGDTATGALADMSWPATGAELKRVAIPATEALGLMSTYHLAEPTVMLVRPDGYIAYIGPAARGSIPLSVISAMTPEAAASP